jgi:uncharacterized membrane protein YphA (DoxX/SURF4 family)
MILEDVPETSGASGVKVGLRPLPGDIAQASPRARYSEECRAFRFEKNAEGSFDSTLSFRKKGGGGSIPHWVEEETWKRKGRFSVVSPLLKRPDLYEPHGDVTTRLWFLLPMRLFVGLSFIFSALDKVEKSMLSQPEIFGRLVRGLIETPDYSSPLFKSFYYAVVEPNLGLAVFALIVGKLLIGLAILTGTFTRLACLLGLVLTLMAFFAYQVPVFSAHHTNSCGVMLLVLFLSGAGRAYGMDHYLRNRLPSWMI